MYMVENGERKIPYMKAIITSIAVIFALFHLYTAAMGRFGALQLRSVHLGFALVLIFLTTSLRQYVKSGKYWPIYIGVILSILSMIVCLYVFQAYYSMSEIAGNIQTLDVIVGIILVVLLLE